MGSVWGVAEGQQCGNATKEGYLSVVVLCIAASGHGVNLLVVQIYFILVLLNNVRAVDFFTAVLFWSASK